jgi:CRP-like cAMP-binding protein
MNQQQYRLMEIMRKIRVFRGLELAQIQRLLRLCSSQMYAPGQKIYVIGEASNEMLILLQGRLVVTSASGDVLGEIAAGTSTGEMGVFTGQPRSANIGALERSVAVVIKKEALDALMAADQKMHVRILKNIVELLSERLAAANVHNDELARKIAALEKEAGFTSDREVADEHDQYPEEEAEDEEDQQPEEEEN